MLNFKVEVSKDSKKYTFVLKSNSELELKEKLHKDWYSILAIEEIADMEVSWKSFYFEVLINSELKRWNINSSDIFKAYTKLRDDLGYTVKYIYDNENASEWEKLSIINMLEKQYDTYKNQVLSKKEQKLEKKEEQIQVETKDNFYAKKELEETYKLIEFILKKLKNIIDLKIDSNLSLEEKMKLTNVYNNIVKIKTSTNIAKLKEIWELALKKVWEIELRVLETKKTKELELVLKETNKLLKKVGSKTSFIEKDKDIVFILKNFFWNTKKYFDTNLKKSEKEKKDYDKESYYYLKNISLLNRYKNLKKQHNKEFLNNILKFVLFLNPENKEFIELYFVKQRLIDQNIKLLELKLQDEYFSYTKVVNTYEKYLKTLLYIFDDIKKPIFYFISLYSVFFIIFIVLNSFFSIDYNINYISIKYLILFILFYLFFELSRSMKLILLNLCIFVLSFVFMQVNF